MHYDIDKEFPDQAIEWLDFGYGEPEEVLARVPAGDDWVIIRDDDAATVGAPCWVGKQTDGDIEIILNDWRNCGGTVSAVFYVKATDERPPIWL